MSSEAIVTVVKMMESLPEVAQNQVADHLRNYLSEIRDEIHWKEVLNKSQTTASLVSMARMVKTQIAEGKASALNLNDL